MSVKLLTLAKSMTSNETLNGLLRWELNGEGEAIAVADNRS